MTTRRQFMSMMTAAAATAVAIPSLLLSGKGTAALSAFPHGWTVIEEYTEPLYGELGDKYAKALFASYRHTAEEAISKVMSKAFQPMTGAEPNE